MNKFLRIIAVTLMVAIAGGSCTEIDDDRAYGTVRIDISTLAEWSVYGVNGLGSYRVFSKDRRQPSNFPYTATTYTGLGGVLLIDIGVGTTQPAAYEMACPYERTKSVVVSIDSNLEAVCPECESRFNVLLGQGAAIEGPAYEKHMAMHSYRVTAMSGGGYLISN